VLAQGVDRKTVTREAEVEVRRRLVALNRVEQGTRAVAD
jgi:hypothetical protein